MKDYNKGKTLYTNLNLKKVKHHFIDKTFLNDIMGKVKDGSLIMKNSTVGLQEIHNYMDSRNSMSKKNKVISYWILQSRHTGEGSCDIIYDTQDLGQVDLRLRRNTDLVIRPKIIERGKKGVPLTIYLEIFGKIGHKVKKFKEIIDVRGIVDRYDTHEVVEI